MSSRSSPPRLASANSRPTTSVEVRSPLPCCRRRTGADSIPSWPRLRADHGALPRLHPADFIGGKRPYRHRAETLKRYLGKNGLRYDNTRLQGRRPDRRCLDSDILPRSAQVVALLAILIVLDSVNPHPEESYEKQYRPDLDYSCRLFADSPGSLDPERRRSLSFKHGRPRHRPASARLRRRHCERGRNHQRWELGGVRE